jgi:hypothetical protein
MLKSVILALPGILLTILCWGTYGPVLHKGQAFMGNDRLKPLICVGAAYFVIAIIIPMLVLAGTGKLGGGWTVRGVSWSMAAGTAGAIGALGIVLALSRGGSPIYVMPLVFGGAPVVNVLVSMYLAGVRVRDAGATLPFFLAGVVMVSVGAAMVLVFAPKAGHAGAAKHSSPAVKPASPAESGAPDAVSTGAGDTK